MSNDSKTDHNKAGKYLKNGQTFHPQYEVNLHEYNVTDTLLGDGDHSQNRGSYNIMKIDKRIDIESNR